MNKLILAFLMFASAGIFAAEPDSVKAAKPKKELSPEKIAERADTKKKFFKQSNDRFAIDLLGSNWIYKSTGDRMNGFKSKWYGRGINVYFYYNFRVKLSRFSFAAGIGYSCSNIYSRHGVVEDSTGITFRKLTDINSSIAESAYKVNKLCIQYLDIPVEFRIHTKPDKLDNMWKFAFGFKAGIRVDAHTKQKTKIGNVVKVDVQRRFPDVNLFRMGPTLRIGYSSFNITGYYGILNVFKKDRGPSANEFAVGISFNGL